MVIGEMLRPVLEKRIDDSNQRRGDRPPYNPVFTFKIINHFGSHIFTGLDISFTVLDKNSTWLFQERPGK